MDALYLAIFAALWLGICGLALGCSRLQGRSGGER